MLSYADLPLDVMQNIFEQDPTLTQQTVNLNKQFSQRMTGKLCQTKITRDEILDYIDTTPNIFALLMKKNNEIRYAIDIYKSAETAGEWTLSRITLYQPPGTHANPERGRDSLIGKNKIISNITDSNNQIILDVYSMFDIYAQRDSCVNSDPSYPRKETKRVFNEIVNTMNKSPAQIISLYLYLIANAQILNINHKIINIPYHSGTAPFIIPLDANNFNTIKQDIPILISQINNKIDNFTYE